jgi:signal transduction histidine kinase
MRTLVRWIERLNTAQRPFWIGAVLSGAVGALFYVITANTIEKDGEERFGNLARTAHYTILGRVKSYTDVLRGSASLFQTSQEVTREQFHRYVDGLKLITEFPGIETINYAFRVSDAERPAFEKRVNAELAAMGRDKPFRILPPGRRPEYLVLTYIEPEENALGKEGFDMMGRPGSLEPLLKSRDTGVVTASGRPIQMRTAITGLGMRLPVYRPGMPVETVQQRRAAYIGSVGIGFSVERLMNGVLEELQVSGMRMRLIGKDDARPGAAPRPILLYDSLAQSGRPAAIAPVALDEFSTSLPVEYNQRNWEVQFRIKKTAMRTGIDAYAPWLALIAGCVSTGLLYSLFYTLTSSRRRAIILAEEMTKELRASEANLQLSNFKLRELAAHAENIKEGERKRIAREIHDDLGQNLLALRIEADLLASRTGERHPLLHERARRTLQQIDTTIKSVRQIINDLRPNVLDLGLNAAVDWQIAEFERRTGISCDLKENDDDIQASDRCATALFRILQESLTNVSRHANASRVEVELRVDFDWFWMTIRDNGTGLQAGGRHKPGSFGLVGIEERVKILGGRCTIGNDPRGGTRVSVSVPLTDDAPPSTPPADKAALPLSADSAVV